MITTTLRTYLHNRTLLKYKYIYHSSMVGAQGFEPWANTLKGYCSTAELYSHTLSYNPVVFFKTLLASANCTTVFVACRRAVQCSLLDFSYHYLQSTELQSHCWSPYKDSNLDQRFWRPICYHCTKEIINTNIDRVVGILHY